MKTLDATFQDVFKAAFTGKCIVLSIFIIKEKKENN